jgi:AcrR family transcriptional regulator
MGEKKEIRINEIIEAAISEFIEKGYGNASMESIAKRAKLSKGGLYHHFKSKAEILFSVNLKFMEPVVELISGMEAERSVVNGLNRFITEYLNYWNDHKRELTLYFLTMNESFSNQQIMDLYKISTRQNFDSFEAMFKKGQEQGVFKKLDERSHTIALISCLDGYLGYMLIDDFIPLETISSEIQKTFINDLINK